MDGDRQPSNTEPARYRRVRSIAAGILVVLFALSLIVAIVGFWVHNTLFDTDEFVGVVERALEDEQFEQSLSNRIAEEVVAALDLEARLESNLSSVNPILANLAGPLSAAADDLIGDAVSEIIGNEGVQALLLDLVQATHQRAVALIQGDTEALANVEIVDGAVTLNLVPVVAEVIRQLANEGLALVGSDLTIPDVREAENARAAAQVLGAALGVDLPDDFGQITILQADRLSALQDSARAFDRLVIALLILPLLLIGLAIAVSPRRRRTAGWLAAGAAIGIVGGALALRFVRNAIEGAVDDPDAVVTVQVLLDSLFRGLTRAMTIILVIAVVSGLGVYLAGRPAWLSKLSASWRDGGLESFAADNRAALLIGGVAVAAVAVIAVGPTLVSVGVIGGLAAAYVWGVNAAAERADTDRAAEDLG